MVRFTQTPCEAGKPYEGMGSHTRAILTKLGYDDEAIARLVEEKTLALAKDEKIAARIC